MLAFILFRLLHLVNVEKLWEEMYSTLTSKLKQGKHCSHIICLLEIFPRQNAINFSYLG